MIQQLRAEIKEAIIEAESIKQEARGLREERVLLESRLESLEALEGGHDAELSTVRAGMRELKESAAKEARALQQATSDAMLSATTEKTRAEGSERELEHYKGMLERYTRLAANKEGDSLHEALREARLEAETAKNALSSFKEAMHNSAEIESPQSARSEDSSGGLDNRMAAMFRQKTDALNLASSKLELAERRNIELQETLREMEWESEALHVRAMDAEAACYALQAQLRDFGVKPNLKRPEVEPQAETDAAQPLSPRLVLNASRESPISDGSDSMTGMMNAAFGWNSRGAEPSRGSRVGGGGSCLDPFEFGMATP